MLPEPSHSPAVCILNNWSVLSAVPLMTALSCTKSCVVLHGWYETLSTLAFFSSGKNWSTCRPGGIDLLKKPSHELADIYSLQEILCVAEEAEMASSISKTIPKEFEQLLSSVFGRHWKEIKYLSFFRVCILCISQCFFSRHSHSLPLFTTVTD